ncbi:uncharacterized protein PV07_06110 [Cladophialophora immunda]|uniref:Zn(2)-C6 fungal-type domain-containing protein n=1 Tax=Cladophialophora immunda TaxID=569365 RepID=A0A0D2CJR8_9EURO|nr:uncharacterized protein PV07_06110 [Cladophialophora immunda]KIW30360.1 hypothetical protein PV07_06110 [Cladophialophora immunda]
MQANASADSLSSPPFSHSPSGRLSDVSLTVKQLQSACAFCKARKIRCDGQLPACSGCRKYGRASSCSLNENGQGAERDYVAYLQSRIHRLRVALHKDVDQGQQGSALRRGTTLYQHGPAASIQGSEAGGGTNVVHDSQRHQKSQIDRLISEIGALPILASSSDPSCLDGPHLATIVLAAASDSMDVPSVIELSQQVEIQALLPRANTARKLANQYFARVYPRLPFFSVQGFWSHFRLVYNDTASDSSRTDDMSNAQSLSRPPGHESEDGLDKVTNIGYSYFTVLIVCAISTASLSRNVDSVISLSAAESFQAALRFREYAILPNTIVGLQAILFLIQYATLNPSQLNAWYLVGVGMRICVDLGLHQDPSGPSIEMSGNLLETRRRLFWSMYSFDRSISLGTGRPCEISDQVIHVDVPHFSIGSEATENEISGYKQRYHVLRLQSLAYEKLYMSEITENPVRLVEELVEQFEDWARKNTMFMSEHARLLLKSEWSQGMMLIYRPCRAIRKRTPEDLRELWRASLSFVKAYRELVEGNEIFYVQIASAKAYTAGLAIIYAYWQLRHIQKVDVDPPETNTDQVDAAAPTQSLDLWRGVADVNFMLRSLSDRWEEGRLLAKRFEKLSTAAVELLIKPQAEQSQGIQDMESHMPKEVVNFWHHSAPTRLQPFDTLRDKQGGSDSRNELQDLVLEITKGKSAR